MTREDRCYLVRRRPNSARRPAVRCDQIRCPGDPRSPARRVPDGPCVGAGGSRFNLIVTLNWVIPLVVPRLGDPRHRHRGRPPQDPGADGHRVALVTLLLLAGLSLLGASPSSTRRGTPLTARVQRRSGTPCSASSRPICAGRCSWRLWSPSGAWLAGPSRHAVWVRSTCCQDGPLGCPAGTRADVGRGPRQPPDRTMPDRSAHGSSEHLNRPAHLRPRRCRPLPRLRRRSDRMEPASSSSSCSPSTSDCSSSSPPGLSRRPASRSRAPVTSVEPQPALAGGTPRMEPPIERRASLHSAFELLDESPLTG